MDAGTRPDLVTSEKAMPGRPYLSGALWMQLLIKEAEEKGFIKSVQKIKLDNDSKKVLKEGVPAQCMANLANQQMYVCSSWVQTLICLLENLECCQFF